MKCIFTGSWMTTGSYWVPAALPKTLPRASMCRKSSITWPATTPDRALQPSGIPEFTEPKHRKREKAGNRAFPLVHGSGELLQVERQSRPSGRRYLAQRSGPDLSSKVRQRDAIARIGSDEFAALLENCGDTEAERWRKESGMPSGTSTFAIRINITGWHQHRVVVINDLSDSPAKLMKLADTSVTLPKQRGNRVHVYRPKPSPRNRKKKPDHH